MLVLEKIQHTNTITKTDDCIHINTLIPNFSYKNKSGKIITFKNCFIKI